MFHVLLFSFFIYFYLCVHFAPMLINFVNKVIFFSNNLPDLILKHLTSVSCVCVMLPDVFNRMKTSRGRSQWGIEGNLHVSLCLFISELWSQTSFLNTLCCILIGPRGAEGVSGGPIRWLLTCAPSHPGLLFTGECRDVTWDGVRRRKQISC